MEKQEEIYSLLKDIGKKLQTLENKKKFLISLGFYSYNEILHLNEEEKKTLIERLKHERRKRLTPKDFSFRLKKDK